MVAKIFASDLGWKKSGFLSVLHMSLISQWGVVIIEINDHEKVVPITYSDNKGPWSDCACAVWTGVLVVGERHNIWDNQIQKWLAYERRCADKIGINLLESCTSMVIFSFRGWNNPDYLIIHSLGFHWTLLIWFRRLGVLELLSFVVFSGIKWTCKKVIVIFKYSLYQYLLIF